MLGIFTRHSLNKVDMLGPTYVREEPAVSCRWTGWVWAITGWSSSTLQENYWSFRGIYRIHLNEWKQQNWKMWTCNRLGSESLRSWPSLSVYMFDKVFASFSLLTHKNLHKNNCTSIDKHILRSWHVLWLVKKKAHVNWHIRNRMTCITRQFEYYELQLKYPENITHNIRRTSYTHLHT